MLSTDSSDGAGTDGLDGICNPIQAPFRWAWLESTRAFIESAIQGIIIALPLAFVVLLFSTQNILIAIYASINIMGVVLCELGLMSLLDWQFGVSESVCVVIIIGFSVDYVVHLANAYLECSFNTREERSSYALLTMGISIVSGATTTIGTAAFLLIPQIVFFEKMGILIISTVLFSIFWAMTFFVALLVTVGPQHRTGNINVKKFRNFCVCNCMTK